MIIDPTTYDGRRHAIPFTRGADFVAKREAYIADGFMVAIADGYLHVAKLMPGEEIPREVVWH